MKTAELSARPSEARVAAQDPLLLMAAAKLRKQNAPKPVDRAATNGETATDTPFGWQEMMPCWA